MLFGGTTMLRKIVDKFLIEQAHIAPEKLANPDLKMLDLGLDSLGVVEMLFEVEDRYGIHIEDAVQFQHMTLSEVVAHMEQLVRAKHGGKIPNLAISDAEKAVS
jgi:acyl carrier protein